MCYGPDLGEVANHHFIPRCGARQSRNIADKYVASVLVNVRSKNAKQRLFLGLVRASWEAGTGTITTRLELFITPNRLTLGQNSAKVSLKMVAVLLWYL